MQGVDVGGLSVQDASIKINEELSPKLSNAHITIYESDDIAAADGAQVSTGDIDQAYADEAMAGSDVSGDGSIDKWSITAETIGAYVDGQALAEEAYLSVAGATSSRIASSRGLAAPGSMPPSP